MVREYKSSTISSWDMMKKAPQATAPKAEISKVVKKVVRDRARVNTAMPSTKQKINPGFWQLSSLR